MRNTLVNTLHDIAKYNDKIFLVVNDLGFSVIEKFQQEFPDGYLNIGVAEANMIGVSAGLALSGKIPFAYSIVPFATMRCFEQIRNDVCYQNVNVKIVGIGGGFAYGGLGPTHHSIEDIAVMRSLPNMTVICPADPVETELATRAAVEYAGPVYIRLGKGGEPILHKTIPEFDIGKGVVMRNGEDITIISTGGMLETALTSAEQLAGSGMESRVISMHTVKPIDKEIILNSAKATKALFTLEEHSIIGGLGSAVSEVLAEANAGVLFKRFGVRDVFQKKVGSQKYLRGINSLSASDIADTILKEMRLRI
jgi:transketolase